MKKIEEYVRMFPDFPKPGVLYRDLTSVVQDAEGLQLAIDLIQDGVEGFGEFDLILGPESRGFILGMPIAYNMKKPFVCARKKGKLPGETVSIEYALEYGSEVIEIHNDAIKPGQKVVIVDDLIATGGTIEAIIKLVGMMGAEVIGCVFLMELKGLEGRKKLEGCTVKSIIEYEGK